jgi:hypothetical protein
MDIAATAGAVVVATHTLALWERTALHTETAPTAGSGQKLLLTELLVRGDSDKTAIA